ncbi:MAG TPA: hypothetical protein VGJ67_07440 [Actinomycetota bacterium]
MHAIATLHFLAGVASRDPGLGHYLRYGAILLATIAFVSIWMVRTWRNAPDPEERWREAQKDRPGVDDVDDVDAPR